MVQFTVQWEAVQEVLIRLVDAHLFRTEMRTRILESTKCVDVSGKHVGRNRASSAAALDSITIPRG